MDPGVMEGAPHPGEQVSGGPLHKIKRMTFLNREAVAVVLQNENGPCPLLALANALLLRGTLELSPERNEIGSEELIGMIADFVLEKNPVDTSRRSERTMTLEKTIEDVIDLLPSLQYGLDVNVHFSGITDFEFDSRISVFDLLSVRLLHGWAVDPDDKIAYDTMHDLSYNQATDKIVGSEEAQTGTGLSSEGSDQATTAILEGEVIRKFLSDTSSQFTFHGLAELHRVMKERELCAFFRNNHFATLFKIDGALYLLVTDQGYQHNTAVAWELLNDIGGNTDLRSPEFGDPNSYLGPEELRIMASVGDADAAANGLKAADIAKARGRNCPISPRRSNAAKKKEAKETEAAWARNRAPSQGEKSPSSSLSPGSRQTFEGVRHSMAESPNADLMLARQLYDEENARNRRRIEAAARRDAAKDKGKGSDCRIC